MTEPNFQAGALGNVWAWVWVPEIQIFDGTKLTQRHIKFVIAPDGNGSRTLSVRWLLSDAMRAYRYPHTFKNNEDVIDGAALAYSDISKGMEPQRWVQYEGPALPRLYVPPDSVQNEAQRAVGWIKEGKQGDGFTAVGRSRAIQLARGEPVTLEDIKDISGFLKRHEVDGKAKGFRPGERGYPSPGRVAWGAWGGWPSKDWTDEILGLGSKLKIPTDWRELEALSRQELIRYIRYEGDPTYDGEGETIKQLRDVAYRLSGGMLSAKLEEQGAEQESKRAKKKELDQAVPKSVKKMMDMSRADLLRAHQALDLPSTEEWLESVPDERLRYEIAKAKGFLTGWLQEAKKNAEIKAREVKQPRLGDPHPDAPMFTYRQTTDLGRLIYEWEPKLDEGEVVFSVSELPAQNRRSIRAFWTLDGVQRHFSFTNIEAQDRSERSMRDAVEIARRALDDFNALDEPRGWRWESGPSWSEQDRIARRRRVRARKQAEAIYDALVEKHAKGGVFDEAMVREVCAELRKGLVTMIAETLEQIIIKKKNRADAENQPTIDPKHKAFFTAEEQRRSRHQEDLIETLDGKRLLTGQERDVLQKLKDVTVNIKEAEAQLLYVPVADKYLAEAQIRAWRQDQFALGEMLRGLRLNKPNDVEYYETMDLNPRVRGQYPVPPMMADVLIAHLVQGGRLRSVNKIYTKPWARSYLEAGVVPIKNGDKKGVSHYFIHEGAVGKNREAKALLHYTQQMIIEDPPRVLIDEIDRLRKAKEEEDARLDAESDNKSDDEESSPQWEEIVIFDVLPEILKRVKEERSNVGYPTAPPSWEWKDNMEREMLSIELDTILRRMAQPPWIGNQPREQRIKQAIHQTVKDKLATELLFLEIKKHRLYNGEPRPASETEGTLKVIENNLSDMGF